MHSRITWKMLLVAVVLALGLWNRVAGQNDIREVSLAGKGSVIGKLNRTANVFQFLGIRYAIYENFQRANETDHYGSFQADNSLPCPQAKDSLEKQDWATTEKFLTLDVYVRSTIYSKPAPVIVYFPGGNHFANARSDYYGPKYLVDRDDTVLIIVNYRVGIYGFLSTGDERLPGNLGLFDQRLALKWVQDYIDKFGGDKNAVTIMGHESGAVSASIHALSEESRRYFQRAIVSGGSPYSPWAFQRNETFSVYQDLAAKLDCGHQNTHVLLECFKGKNPGDILRVQQEFEKGTFVPILDTNFTNNEAERFFKKDKDPRQLLDVGTLMNIPVIFGITKNPGAVDYFDTLDTLKKEQDPLYWYLKRQIFPFTKNVDYMTAVQKHQLDSIIKGVKYLYFKDVNPSAWSESTSIWIEFMSDFLYNSGVDLMARKWGKRVTQGTYMYDLEFAGAYTWGELEFKEQSYKEYAPTQMDDIFYFFETHKFDGAVSRKENNEITLYNSYRITLLKAWMQFFKDGNLANNLVQFVSPTNVRFNWTPYSGNYSTLRILNSTETNPKESYWMHSQYRSAKLEYFSVMVQELLWTEHVFYDHQELNQQYKSATWGFMSAFIILCIICILLILYNMKVSKKSKTYKSGGFTQVSTTNPGESVEFRGV